MQLSSKIVKRKNEGMFPNGTSSSVGMRSFCRIHRFIFITLRSAMEKRTSSQLRFESVGEYAVVD